MEKKRMLIIMIICIFGLSCIIFLLINHKEQPINPNASCRLNENEIIELSEKAKSGDGEAAISLANYYEFVEKDKVKAAEWLKLGADNGNASCQWNYACYLVDVYNFENIGSMDDAIIYMKKAAENGNEYAKKHLEILKIPY